MGVSEKTGEVKWFVFLVAVVFGWDSMAVEFGAVYKDVFYRERRLARAASRFFATV